MQKNLVIVESPAKAKTIERFLGKDYKVMSSYGHIRDLKKRELSIDTDTLVPDYEIPAEKKKLVASLRDEARKADKVWLASDEDREGEAISWHLCEVLGLDEKNTSRIVFHEITKPAILEAITKPRSINMDLVNAQQARRVLDRIVGFKLSPVLWRKVKPALSAGRVQSVAVRLIVEREREIQAFQSEPYYRVNATFGCTNADGTNNMEALNLTIHQPDTTHLRAEACESYSWNNTTYTESGSYYKKLTNKYGCDSVIVLHLTIFNGSHNVFSKDTCEYYVWNGQTYTESGIYTYAYTNAYGCASVDTLHLTIYHGTHNVIKEIVCESYTWHDTLYTESGIYTYTYENEYGCASVDTLYLTVHYGTHNVETLNACGSYEWHGQTYTESGTYTYAYNNEYRCLSVDTLKVVVVLVDEKSCSLAPCVTDVDGNMYSTVQIGGQCWMRSNLRTTHYADSTAIPTGNISSTDPYYYDSQSNRLDLAIRGYHYNQPAVMHNQSSSTANPSGV